MRNVQVSQHLVYSFSQFQYVENVHVCIVSPTFVMQLLVMYEL